MILPTYPTLRDRARDDKEYDLKYKLLMKEFAEAFAKAEPPLKLTERQIQEYLDRKVRSCYVLKKCVNIGITRRRI
jgi:hypothetical protein